MIDQMTPSKQCAFCFSSDKLSGEHVWSKWIVELLEPAIPGFDFRYRDTEANIDKSWSSSRMDQKTKVVCKPCNETWMCAIEADAKATLSNIIRDGNAVSFLPGGVVSLARFAFKCAVVANHMSLEGGRPFFSPFARRCFRETYRIPDGVSMWFASYRGASRYSGRFSSLYAIPTVQAFNNLAFNVFTFAAGRLAFQVVSARWTKLHRVGPKLPLVLHPNESQWGDAATRFWPSDGLPPHWPPPRDLDDDGIRAFRDRWRMMSIY